MTIYNITPKTHILNSLVNAELPQKHITALNEFIDNSLGEGSGNATTVQIHYKKDALVIIDNGKGVDNIEALFTIGDSQNRLNSADIGNYGYGSKVGALYLGWSVEVHTVQDGIYKSMSVDWEFVEKSGEWPSLKEIVKPSSKAPDVIKHGGTMIKIENRHDFRQWQSNSLVDKMALTYAPALKNGKEIQLYHYEPNGKKAKKFELTKYVSKNKLSDKIEFSGEIHGKKFTGVAGKKAVSKLAHNALHIGFGHRVIKSMYSLNGSPLPSTFYGEVMLDKDWKKSLTATKNDIAIHKDELINAIYEHVASLLDGMTFEEESVYLDFMNTQVAEAMEQAMLTLTSGKGDYAQGEAVLVGEKVEHANPDPVDPTDKEPLEKHQAIDGGDTAAEESTPKKAGLKIEYISDLGEKVYVTESSDNSLKVFINKDLEYIKDAKQSPMNVSAIWAIVAQAISEHVYESPAERASIICGLHIDGTDDNKLAKQSLYYKLLTQAKQLKEPTKSELKAAQAVAA